MKQAILTKYLEFKNTGEDFSAFFSAEAYIRSNGWSLGSMECDRPIGVCKESGAYISKWTRMSDDDRAKLDGRIESVDYRYGDVKIVWRDL